jgi:hypothetical protein
MEIALSQKNAPRHDGLGMAGPGGVWQECSGLGRRPGGRVVHFRVSRARVYNGWHSVMARPFGGHLRGALGARLLGEDEGDDLSLDGIR